MSGVDTKKLRELAESATPGAAERAGENHAVRAHRFHEAANPQTVIALLDEIERLRASAEWEREINHGKGGLLDKLAAMTAERDVLAAAVKHGAALYREMTKARDEACDLALVMSYQGGATDYRVARIAELRKVGES